MPQKWAKWTKEEIGVLKLWLSKGLSVNECAENMNYRSYAAVCNMCARIGGAKLNSKYECTNRQLKKYNQNPVTDTTIMLINNYFKDNKRKYGNDLQKNIKNIELTLNRPPELIKTILYKLGLIKATKT